MGSKTNYGDWRATMDDKGTAWVSFDKRDSAVNILEPANLAQLETLLGDLTQEKVNAMVLQSGKKSGFCAGANIKFFAAVEENPDELQAMIEMGQRVFKKLEQVPFFTLAVIEGFCLGGGLEMVLACNLRMAVNTEKTRLGFPEVTLGVVTGWGGSVRSARKMSCPAALEMVVSGKPVDAKTAEKMGLAIAVEKRHVEDAIYTIINTRMPHTKSWNKGWHQVLEWGWQSSWVRLLVLGLAKQKLAKKINSAHYPAPFELLKNWQKTDVLHDDRAYQEEIETFMRLVKTETSENLVRCFYLREDLKGQSGNPDADVKALQVLVIGAGRMGGDIAAWLAMRGSQVCLRDENPERIAMAIKEAQGLFQKKLKSPIERQAAMDRLIPDMKGEGVKKADLIIEAVFEDLQVKQAVLQTVERQMKAGAILATNTSTIPLEKLSTVLNNPDRLVGLHFFNPVPFMPLVEVVRGKQTDPTVLSNAIAWVKQWGKLPLVVKSAPGFVVNGILMPYLMEAVLLLEEGFAAKTVDAVAVQAGFPMGPFLLMDTVGIDVCVMVVKNLMPKAQVPQTLNRLVESGALGKKTHRGFYAYVSGKPVNAKGNAKSAPSDVLDRLMVRLWNAAEAVLQEDIVSARDDIDAALLFGAGFPPFQGGLLHSIDKRKHDFEQKRAALIARYGERFNLTT